MYKFLDYVSPVVVEMYLIQITYLSSVQLSDENSSSGLRLRILSRLAVVKITTEKIAVHLLVIRLATMDTLKMYAYAVYRADPSYLMNKRTYFVSYQNKNRSIPNIFLVHLKCRLKPLFQRKA